MKNDCAFIHDFYIDLYGVTVWFIDNIAGSTLKRIIKEEFDLDWEDENPGWAGKCLEVCSKKGGYVVMICLPKPLNPRDPRQMGTLGHEVFHATEYIMAKIGTKHSEATSEPWAYLAGTIQRMCMLSLTRKRVGSKKPITVPHGGVGPYGAGAKTSSSSPIE